MYNIFLGTVSLKDKVSSAELIDCDPSTTFCNVYQWWHNIQMCVVPARALPVRALHCKASNILLVFTPVRMYWHFYNLANHSRKKESTNNVWYHRLTLIGWMLNVKRVWSKKSCRLLQGLDGHCIEKKRVIWFWIM